MYREVAARSIADTVGHAARLRAAGGFAGNLRADRGAVAARDLELQLELVPPRTAVPPQFGALAVRRYRNLHPSIAVKIGENCSATQPRRSELFPSQVRNIGELSASVVKDAVGLGVLHLKAACRDEQVQPAIVVKVHQAAAPAAPGTA